MSIAVSFVYFAVGIDRKCGRMSTSRDPENSECTADLGAQYLTVTPDYAQDHESYYAELISVGLTQELSGGIEGIKSSRYPANTKHYVTPQGISSIVKHFLMKSDSNVLFNHSLTSIELQGQGSDAKLHTKHDEDGIESIHPAPPYYDAVILTIPTPQVIKIQGLVAETLKEKPSVKEKLEKVNYSSRYALALFFPPGVTPDVPWNARYEQEDECIRWISIDNKKRQNEEACSAVVVHTSVPFGIKHLEADKQLVEQIIKQHLDNLMPNLPSPVRSKCQRWRYSQVSTPYEGSPGTLVLAEGPSYILLVAGDGMSHSNFDGCIASAEATCKKLIHHWKTNSQL
ncbi:renalase-like isoform X2 [Apostichopus japonicus]|uniref:renalase-like isoform X2 n=1 Tax=Stichopus japonicus TaxID=307972 RepID=UPI003AB2A661